MDRNGLTIETGVGTLFALVALMVVSVWLGTKAQRAVDRGSFLKGFFLGNRGLGPWAIALTATVQSGGTFMGFPSLVYTSGWVVAFWISSYMVVPITGIAVLGRRFAQLSRRTGAITVPDLLRARFESPSLGLITSLLIMCFISFTMVAQFKAGAIVMKLAWPTGGSFSLAEEVPPGELDWGYLLGLLIFSLIVVGYTLIGGFLASVWTDLFQSLMMALGVVLLFFLVVPLGNEESMAEASLGAAKAAGPDFLLGPGISKAGAEFLPLGAAISMFVVWIFGGIGTPAGMVRLMASRDTATLQRSIVLLSFYNLLIYLPLVVICVSARNIFPNLAHSDEVIPRLAIWSTREWTGGSLIAGLILTAPFGAVMASVSGFLVLITSGLVRDIYQRTINPLASEKQVRFATRVVMLLLGVMAFAANLRPVEHLQTLIVFSSTSMAAAFVVPAMMAAYWRRATAAGALTAMLSGVATVAIICLALGAINANLWGINAGVYGLIVSTVCGVVVSLCSRTPSETLLAKLFDAVPTDTIQMRRTYPSVTSTN